MWNVAIIGFVKSRKYKKDWNIGEIWKQEKSLCSKIFNFWRLFFQDTHYLFYSILLSICTLKSNRLTIVSMKTLQWKLSNNNVVVVVAAAFHWKLIIPLPSLSLLINLLFRRKLKGQAFSFWLKINESPSRSHKTF